MRAALEVREEERRGCAHAAGEEHRFLGAFELDCDLDGAIRFTDACRLPYIAPSLGGVESLIEMPVTMSFWDVDREERIKLGITDSLIRLSLGIEDPEDILADLEQALSAI